MLNGIAPILIFNFKKLAPSFLEDVNKTPLLAKNNIAIPLIPIPIYLDEKLTGIYIDSESKNIDIETKVQTKPDGTAGDVSQRGLNSVVSINMLARSDSVGLSVLIAMSDLIFQKVTSQEYSVSYIHKAVTVFGGLLESFSAVQNTSNDLYNISMQISRANGGSTVEKKSPSVELKNTAVTPSP
jgi:hypothetical protein